LLVAGTSLGKARIHLQRHLTGRKLCVVLAHSPLHAKPIHSHLRVPRCMQQQVLSDLWTSHNQHGENICQHRIAITDIPACLLPALLRRIEQLQGSVNKLTSVVDTLALSTMAPAPSAMRTRDDDATRNTRPYTEIPRTVTLPTIFVYTRPHSVFPPSLSVPTPSPPRCLCL
jgi:hypothetical protein